MTREELIRDEDYTEEEAEKMILQSKLDKLQEENEELKQDIKILKTHIATTTIRIELDKKINERCLKEETKASIRKMIELEIKYDEELLKLLKCDE